ncbi:MAG: hypothetical protein ACI9GW_001828 [Halieaceae bacterium]|jgi:hypothetical protein
MTSTPRYSCDRQSTLGFPEQRPAAYHLLVDEPVFDPTLHLDLQFPSTVTSLADLNYSAEDIADCPSSFGYCNAFKVLSAEGVSVMRDICGRIYHNRNRSDGTGQNRLGSYARGAGYRSRFIRDFCDCPELLAHMSTITSVTLGRHSVPAVACGINYAPDDIEKAVDTWHVDSVAFDMVMMVSDPAGMEGGEFQVFNGSKDEGGRLLGIQGEEGGDVELPADRVETILFPTAGYGFLQQGNMIFHRACRLQKKCARITMIPSFEVIPASEPDATNSVNMLGWGDPGMPAELARREVWRATARLEKLLDEIELDANPASLCADIERALQPLSVFQNSLKDK